MAGDLGMTCAKVVVRARLVLPGGRSFEGENDCRNPQPTCPRLPGEGYEKCRSVCRQTGHAEQRALLAAHAAGVFELQGAVMYVDYKPCATCAEMCKVFGVTISE